MGSKKAGAVLGVLLVSCAAGASAQTQAERDRAALRQFPEVGRTARDVSPIIDRAARNENERSAQQATGNRATVTSRDRPANSPLSSRAHDRGAVDVVTPNMGSDARNISRNAGSQNTVIHERPVRPPQGNYDVHTSYRNGQQVRSSQQPPRATGEHIHIQPEYNRRLHDATTPSRPRTEGGVRSSDTSSSRSSSSSSSRSSSSSSSRSSSRYSSAR